MLDEKTVLELITIIVVAIALIVIIFRLTNPKSKACKMNCKFSKGTGFNIKIKVETTEKSTPSQQD